MNTARTLRSPVAWWRDPWRPPRILVGVTVIYLVWSLLPVLIAVMFSFNDGRSAHVGRASRSAGTGATR